jgi:prevent-host-death family protein
VFVSSESPNHLGSIAEAAITLEAIRLGVEVYKPASEHARADLIFGIGQRTFRIQCKSARRRGDVIAIRFVTSRHTPNGYVRTKYSSREIDFFAAHCRELDRNFLIPIDLVDGHSGLFLRLSPPRNGQRAAIQFAEDFTFAGAVAQLERAPAWHAGGRRFESGQLHSLDSSEPSPGTVGAHEFRNCFGWYMERAAAGTEIRVTKRGRPYVRLVPFQQPLEDTA